MGRITLFVTESCSYCLRAKHALEERGIPFEQISVSSFPERRKDMLSLSNQLTVPQVFFNDEHVGGATDLLRVLAIWDGEDTESPTAEESSSSSASSSSLQKVTALERYHKEIASKPSPTDERLALTDEELLQQRQNEVKDGIPADICAFGCFLLPNGQPVSVRELLNDLMKVFPRHEKLPYMAKYYVNCFPGDSGVDALLSHYAPHLRTREEAVAFGLALQQYGVIHHVCDEHAFADTGSLYFRLQPYHEPSVLNSFQKSHRCNIPNMLAYSDDESSSELISESLLEATTTRIDPMILIKKLRSLLQKIQSKYTDSQGMDYLAARDSPEFILLEEAACEVQCVKMKDMDDDMKTAFGLNLYNVMIQHAFIKVGIPKSGSQRGSFYGGVCYNVGGHVLSLDDVEHGILRANTRHPYALSAPLQEKERRELSVSDFDPRIHFALNCGANSCPPVSNYTPEALEEELRIAAMSFCESDSNVLVNEDKMELHLSKIFHWYKTDFLTKSSITAYKPQIQHIVLSYLRGEKKKALQRMMHKAATGNGKKKNAIKVKYLTYDWGTTASRSADFHSKVLTKTQNSFMAALKRYATKEVVAPPKPDLTKIASARVTKSLQTTKTRIASERVVSKTGKNRLAGDRKSKSENNRLGGGTFMTAEA